MLEILREDNAQTIFIQKYNGTPDQERDQRAADPLASKGPCGIFFPVVPEICARDHKESRHREMSDDLDHKAYIPERGLTVGIQDRITVKPDHADTGKNIQNIKIKNTVFFHEKLLSHRVIMLQIFLIRI